MLFDQISDCLFHRANNVVESVSVDVLGKERRHFNLEHVRVVAILMTWCHQISETETLSEVKVAVARTACGYGAATCDL